MIFHMFKGYAATVLLSTKVATTLLFPYPIEKAFTGWSSGDVELYKSKDKKVLVLRSKTQMLNSNLVVITQGGTYDFNVKLDENRPHAGSIQIVNGAQSTSFTLKKKTRDYKILEGQSTLYITTQKELKINNKLVNGQVIVPKGPPLYINGKRELF